MTEFLVASRNVVLIIEASDTKQAMDLVVDTLLPHPYDKKYENIVAAPRPETPEEWEELDRKLVVGNGEFAEYYGYPNRCSDKLREFTKQVVEEQRGQLTRNRAKGLNELALLAEAHPGLRPMAITMFEKALGDESASIRVTAAEALWIVDATSSAALLTKAAAVETVDDVKGFILHAASLLGSTPADTGPPPQTPG